MWLSRQPIPNRARLLTGAVFKKLPVLRRCVGIIAFALVLSVGFSCNRPTSSRTRPTPEPEANRVPDEMPVADQPKRIAVTLSKDDNGKTASVESGSDVVITLPSKPSTGYDWIVDEQSAALPRPTADFEPAGSDNEGGGGSRRLTWHTDGLKGEYKITLVYKRPQDKKTPPAETFDVILRIE